MTTSESDRPARKTVLIVDDHPVLRRGLASLIESDPDLAVCGEAASYLAALDMIREHSPDLAIVDLELAGSDGLELVKEMQVRYPAVPALMLSMYDEEVYAERALRAGARGYLTKQQLDETLLVAIHRVLDGGIYMSRALESRLAAMFVGGRTREAVPPLDTLSDRELQVFRLIGHGQSTRQIAETLHLSVKTIETYRGHLKQKLNLDTAQQLAQRAARWVNPGVEG